MREIAATEAKSKFLQFLDEVERGETIRITRHGRPIARIVPDAEARAEAADRAVAAIRAIRKQSKGMTIEEILALRDDSRRF